MESARTAWVGLVVLVVLTVAAGGIAAAAGTTDVMLSPENETVEPGATVTYDVVVAEAAGGVGSFEATVSTNDSSVATFGASTTPAIRPTRASRRGPTR